MAKKREEIQVSDNSPKMVVGLDIGTTKIVMVAGYLRKDGTIEICGCGKTPSTGVEFGSVFNVQETINDILTAKKQLEEYLNESIASVYVGIAGRHIKSRSYTNSILRKNGHDTMVSQEEIDNMIAQMRSLSIDSGEIIEVIPQNYQVDGQETMRPVGTLAQRVNGFYQLIIGNSFEVKKIMKSIQESNLLCNQMILEPMVSALVCLTEEEKKQGVALIDIGGGTTDLVIYVENMPVFIKVIPVGGCVITKDIESLGITFEQAEKLKIEYGTCLVKNANKDHYITISDSTNSVEPMRINEASLAQVINARVQQDILTPVKREIENSGYASKVRNIVITGGGALLRDIRPLSDFVIQKRTRLGDPNVGISGSMDDHFRDPIFSTALGLLRYGCLRENSPIVEEESQDPNRRNEPQEERGDNGIKNPLGEWFKSIYSKVTEWADNLNMEGTD